MSLFKTKEPSLKPRNSAEGCHACKLTLEFAVLLIERSTDFSWLPALVALVIAKIANTNLLYCGICSTTSVLE